MLERDIFIQNTKYLFEFYWYLHFPRHLDTSAVTSGLLWYV